jgi:hypothetical protein
MLFKIDLLNKALSNKTYIKRKLKSIAKMETKRCSSCESEKDLNEFNNLRSSSDGKHNVCRVCSNETSRLWRINNRRHVNNYMSQHYATNPQYRIKTSMLNRLNRFIKNGIYSRRTEELIGCSRQVFTDWIYFNLEDGMTFENHGTLWSFDMVIPFKAFDLTNEDDLRAVMNYSNIKPCIKDMNWRKNAAILPFFIANQKIRFHAFNRMRNLQKQNL